MAKFECWEFKGRGDPVFGGSADDRVLYRLANGAHKFIAGCDLYKHPGAMRALFDDQEQAETAGIAASERAPSLISGMLHRPNGEGEIAIVA